MLPPPAKMLELAVGGEFSLKGSFVFEASARTNAFLLRGELATRGGVKQRRGGAHRTSLRVGAGRLAATSGGDASLGDDTRSVCERSARRVRKPLNGIPREQPSQSPGRVSKQRLARMLGDDFPRQIPQSDHLPQLS